MKGNRTFFNYFKDELNVIYYTKNYKGHVKDNDELIRIELLLLRVLQRTSMHY